MPRSRWFLPLVLMMSACLNLSSQAQEKPDDSMIGAKPPEGAVVLFKGTDLKGWVKRDGKSPADWPVADGIITVGKGDIMTEKPFGNFQLHLEFNVPYMPDARGQGRGNSGVYLDGIYELQVLDSYGLKPKNNDCGAIYTQLVPRVNACKPPLQWQTYDVTFKKAVVEEGKVVKKAASHGDPQRHQDDRRRGDRDHPRRRGQQGRRGWSHPAPGSRERRAISEYLDQASGLVAGGWLRRVLCEHRTGLVPRIGAHRAPYEPMRIPSVEPPKVRRRRLP